MKQQVERTAKAYCWVEVKDCETGERFKGTHTFLGENSNVCMHVCLLRAVYEMI
jgi:hypothetical protein